MNAQDRGAEPAYPGTIEREDSLGKWTQYQSGLTMREAFAMAALTGILAGPAEDFGEDDLSPDGAAEMAVQYADALLNRLSLNQEPRT